MNAPMRRLALAVLGMFGLLLLNANYVHVVKAEDYRTDSRNSRVLIQTYERERGPILVSADGEQNAIARSTETDDRLKYLREYADGPVYAPITGFYSLVYGGSGIEREENDLLTGESDELFVRRLSDLVTGREPQGGAVLLTVDPRVQAAAFEGLSGQTGAAVALDPRTGAILAMANRPTFDPNVLSSHDPKEIRAAYERLTNDATRPLANRALRETYPPGSIFKVVTAAAALSSGRYTTETLIPSPVALDLPLTTNVLRNFAGQSCPSSDRTSLLDSLRTSCNTSFGQLGLDLGDDALRDQAQKFGFGERYSTPMPAAESVFPEEPDEPQTAYSAIGQFDVRLTPLQAAMVAAGVANGGKVMKPHLVQQLIGPDLDVLEETDPEELSTAVSPEVAAQLTTMMEAVVADGTGTRAQIDGVRVAGKTGSAQSVEGRDPLAWFIGFAPADNPRVAVAVLIERGGSEATGGRVAAPIARSIMAAALARQEAAP